MSTPQFTDDLVYVMSTPRGRRFIWGLMGLCGKGQQPLVIGAPDATSFNLGKMDVSLQLEALADPDLYVQMTKEAKEADYDRTDSDTSSDPDPFGGITITDTSDTSTNS